MTIGNAVTKAVASGRVLIHLHTHPWHGPTAFSETDLATFHKTSVWASATFQLIQAAVVLGADAGSVDAVVWSSHEEEVVPISEIHVVGSPFSLYTPTRAQVRLAIVEELANEHALKTATLATRLPRYDRQIRAYGLELQRIFASLRVGIVGISGTGSHMAVELAYLGVGDFVLCDPETIGIENINRILGATDEDVGKPKVAYAEKIIKAINRWAQVHPLRCSILEDSAVESLKAVDLLFGCTDTASSRMLMNDLACQYHIPYIDVGTGIFVSEQRITDMGGQLHILLPDSPCLDCRDALNRERAGQELTDD
jgi:molybdopterin/thiamine biosynthesis adenylyltransferase